MSKTARAMQKAIFETLNSDTALTSIIGADQIFDHQITKANPPYIILSNWQVSDWSTSTEDGEEHGFSVEIWTDDRGRKSAQEIAGIVINLLHDQSPSIENSHIVNLRYENAFFSSEGDIKLQLTRLNFRAVVEI